MSVVQFSDAIDSSADLQIWNNEAFDNGENSEDLTGSRQSWGSLKSIFRNSKGVFDTISGKENPGFRMENQISSVSSLNSSPVPFKPVTTYESVEKSKINCVLVKGFGRDEVSKSEIGEETQDEKKIDEEIEEVESQILRLKSRLEGLKVARAERGVEFVKNRGRVEPSKIMEQKQSIKMAEEYKIIEETSNISASTKVDRKGISLGHAKNISGGRRGMSMGPSEILRAVKSRQSDKQEMVTPLQSRRKSCFWKLQEIDDEKVVDKEKVESSSVSPKSRKVAAQNHVLSRQAVTTIGSRKALKKEDAVISSIQPKKLFNNGDKSVPATNKKISRLGRVVPSRYSQDTTQTSAMRKRSLPGNDNENRKTVDKKRSLSVGKSRANENEGKNVSRLKKKWEIPSEIVVHCSNAEDEESPQPNVVVPDLLPRLRIVPGMKDSPRDSGPAKKVCELIGKKSFFSNDEDVEASVCQALSYPDEDDEES